ncbi:hypothetical protein EMCRGX_G033567 [Ephydatia muelleri]
MYKEENELNKMMLIKILQNVRFLARQGLSLRGHKDDEDSNFTQLLLLRSIGCPEVLTWMKKKTNKYTSGDIQNEFLQVMALHILRNICSDIVKNGFYTIMADECTDVSNKEQFMVCIRWVDNTTLIHHEDCVGCKNGVATQTQAKEKKAILTHCYGHALNLAVSDCIKQSKLCQDAMDSAFEISKLIRYSPKRNAAFDRIRVENVTDDDSTVHSVGIRALCPTRWTVRGDAIESILEHYNTLKQLWEDNLSRTLQTRSMSASEGQSVVELSVKTLQLMQNDESFDAFFRLVNCFREQTGTSSPKLPRKRKAPSRFEVGEGKESYNDSSIEDHYRRLYFEVLDLAVTGISQQLNQTGYSIYKNLENLLVYAANRKPFDEQLCAVLSHYGDDLVSCQLSAQLQIWGAYFAEHCEPVSLRDCIQALQKMSATQKELLSEVCKLA